MIHKVISGGQTGVDRAALDAALARGYEIGGWCPGGRRAEDGSIPSRYPLAETKSRQYPPRTAMTVREADATLVLHLGTLDRASQLALEIAARSHKPCAAFDLARPEAVDAARQWLEQIHPATLNISGPRESTQRGIYPRAYGFLARLLGKRHPRDSWAGSRHELAAS
jgi:predicted Rossmann-fold nucleotide-binding protein